MGDFSLAFQNIATKSIKKTENVIKKTVFDLTSSIISDTPADTSRAKNNWFVTFDTPNDNTFRTLDETGSVAINKASDKIINNKVPMVYWIQNNLPYIAKLEFGLYPKTSTTGKTLNGYSVKANQGMVRINVQRFNKFLKDNVK